MKILATVGAFALGLISEDVVWIFSNLIGKPIEEEAMGCLCSGIFALLLLLLLERLKVFTKRASIPASGCWNLILLFLLLAGVMFGSLLAAATRGIPWLSWLSYGQTVGISVDNPMILDLAVIQLAFGFELGVNIAQIICVLIAIFAYKGLVSRL